MKENGFTLIEMMLVVVLFVFLFTAVLTVFTMSDKSWRLGQNKLSEQQEARRAMDDMTRMLRQSSPGLTINTTVYPLAITNNSTRIDFYQPVMALNGTIIPRKITYRLDSASPRRLLKKEGAAAEVVAANEIDALSFGGGCSGCSAYNCTSVAGNCPVVEMRITTKKRTSIELEHPSFNLTSRATLRNGDLILPAGTQIEGEN